MTEPTFIAFYDGVKLRVSPPMFLNNTIKVQPGDLSKLAPQGNGIYGYQEGMNADVIKGAPTQEESGGVIYFGNGVTREDFEALMRVMQVTSAHTVNPSKDYAVFTQESEKPGADGYLHQMRIVSKFGMRFMFGALYEQEYKEYPEQEVGVVDALWAFMASEKMRWGTSFSDDGKGLRGLFGGDGDFAREELAFGFTVENEYHSVYRIWSRAWLVTK